MQQTILLKSLKRSFWVLALLVSAMQTKGATKFDFVTTSSKVSILYASDDLKLDSIIAHLLSTDIESVTGYRPFVTNDLARVKGNVIFIGTAKSQLIRAFGSKLNLTDLKDKWEQYQITTINQPFKNIDQALVITGSDPRGTAYGVFDISKRIGVTPWSWWADATPNVQKTLSIDISTFNSPAPSVKYRGIFINDEDWGLQPWAAKTFEKETGDIGPKTYAKVFELLLRLKANLIWPAMHYSTRAFFHYPGNVKVADDYQIVIGSSHAEPMLRNNVDEWNQKTMGAFNYLTNQQKIDAYWESRVKEAGPNNRIYTVGMRGVSDGPIQGVKTKEETVPLLERIFSNQRNMLKNLVNPDITQVPQAFTPYKEVLDLYDAGLKVPDDVTLVWPDDNYGYIQRLSDERENTRSGGSGVYYHISYYGRPHDYQWLCSSSPGLMREEMTKAYDMNARKIWVLNVGDIKPDEYQTELFLDMAYNIKPFYDNSYTKQHLRNWVNFNISDRYASDITDVLWRFYELSFERKPEFMGWSQTEPNTPVHLTDYNHYAYGDQAQHRIDLYNKLEGDTKKIKAKISPSRQDAFYQLAYYPIVGASLMTKKFLYRDKAFLYGSEGRIISNYFASLSKQAYQGIVDETNYYNTKLSSGKWAHMMSFDPRKLSALIAPELDFKINKRAESWVAIPEGIVDTVATLAPLSLPKYDRPGEQHFIDVFLTDSKIVDYSVHVSAPWIKVSKTGGKLTPAGGGSQNRLWVTINWQAVPKGKQANGEIIIQAAGKQTSIAVSAGNNLAPLKNFNGFIEHNGYVSIYAKHFQDRKDNGTDHWGRVSGLGETDTLMEALPITIKASVKKDLSEEGIRQKPSVSYDFYTFQAAPAEFKFFTLPTFALNRDFGVRYAVSVDNGTPTVLDFKTFGRSEEWKQAVLSNSIIRSLKLSSLNSGKHTLRIYMIDPGVILDRIIINLGGPQLFYGMLPETRNN
ncbi:glycosyl hydrolase 115 family protein [Mucilaginibacter yixingensis]